MSPSSSTDSSKTFTRQPSIQPGKTARKKTAITNTPLSKDSHKLHAEHGFESPEIGSRSERESNKSKSSRHASSLKSDSSLRQKELYVSKSGKFAPTTHFKPKNLTFNLIGSGTESAMSSTDHSRRQTSVPYFFLLFEAITHLHIRVARCRLPTSRTEAFDAERGPDQTHHGLHHHGLPRLHGSLQDFQSQVIQRSRRFFEVLQFWHRFFSLFTDCCQSTGVGRI